MAVVEKAAVSGAALSLLLKECLSADDQEGFLFGNVTENVTNHISDLQQENSVTEIVVNVTSVLPVPDVGLFYHPSGKIKENVVHEMVSDAAPNVVGWYKYRRNNHLIPTLRDRIISKGLKKLFEQYSKTMFTYCNITSRRSYENSTHAYTYRFSKVNRNGEIEMLEDVTNNLGEKVTGYKRGVKGDKNDPFNKAVYSEFGKGIRDVAGGVEKALRLAANEAIDNEINIQKVSLEIYQMSNILRDYHQNSSCLMKTTNEPTGRRKEEKNAVEPITAPLDDAAAATASEPFSFVNDLIKVERSKHSNASDAAQKSNEACAMLPELVNNTEKKSKTKTSGHKRIHSEGALQSTDIMEK